MLQKKNNRLPNQSLKSHWEFFFFCLSEDVIFIHSSDVLTVSRSGKEFIKPIPPTLEGVEVDQSVMEVDPSVLNQFIIVCFRIAGREQRTRAMPFCN
ncbi:hypothetical protein CDAR_611241 [Caerostris darwini]|uniref:Uncharacterized protein n=1 Tax=Caerostris darwini TaxID=1538125 RepID=A0AAV4TGL6_9ARAC|nr:hypothetical protein CDAR_611241 [Caerostris darwini]